MRLRLSCEAVLEYLARRERERLLTDMERAARAMAAADPEVVEPPEEFLSADLEVLRRADQRILDEDARQ